MNISEFAQITRKIIVSGGGLDEFIPVACYPARRQIRALEGVPDGVGLEAAVLEWARQGCDGPAEECLVAFRHSSSEFKIVRFISQSEESELYAV
jgi:hypothetical protein